MITLGFSLPINTLSMQGPSRSICMNVDSIVGTDWVWQSGKKVPVKLDFVEKICFLKILAAFERSKTSEYVSHEEISIKALLMSQSNASS